MFSKAVSAVLTGIDSRIIQVEADITSGLPYFEMVGYLSAEVKEAKERVRTAIKNAGFLLDPKHIIVNLSPADLRKSGTSYDLAIAAAVLCGYGIISQRSLDDTVFVGELSLNGRVRPVNGVLSIALMARKTGYRRCIVPSGNAFEGAAADGIEVYGVNDLREMADFLNGKLPLRAAVIDREEVMRAGARGDGTDEPDFSDIHGQPLLKRAMEIAAAGMHHILLIGPPGAGKSMAARRLPTILPEMTWEECLEVSEIYSAAGLLHDEGRLITSRPFRSPHHTATDVSLAGGGRIPHPGEISLAHRGVLFLDEITEFSSQAMEVLRQPLENGVITVNRMQASCEFPADFMLVAAMNPCRCGNFPDMSRCTCTPLQIRRFLGRISQPLMDRIDLNVEVQPVSIDWLQNVSEYDESSADIRLRVEKARKIQSARYEGSPYLYNSQLTDKDVDKYCPLDDAGSEFMRQVYERFGISARTYHKIIKVARTIADLSGREDVGTDELGEAVCFKALDKEYWGGGREKR